MQFDGPLHNSSFGGVGCTHGGYFRVCGSIDCHVLVRAFSRRVGGPAVAIILVNLIGAGVATGGATQIAVASRNGLRIDVIGARSDEVRDVLIIERDISSCSAIDK